MEDSVRETNSCLQAACHMYFDRVLYDLMKDGMCIERNKIWHLWNSGVCTSPVCCNCSQKKMFSSNLRSNRQLEARLPLIFSCRIFRNFALAPTFSIDPLFGKADMGSLMHALPWVWQSDDSFRALLRGGPRQRKLKMWFQALEFAVCCTVAKHIFCCCKRAGARTRMTRDARLASSF